MSDNFESPGDLEKLKKRNPAYLAMLFCDLNPRLLRMLASHGFFAESAEELLHQCWETFFSQLDKFEGRSKISTFLFGILINKIREERRRVSKVEIVEESENVIEQNFDKDGFLI